MSFQPLKFHTAKITARKRRLYRYKELKARRSILVCVAGIAGSVQRLTKGWTIWGSNPSGGEIFFIHPERRWGPPDSYVRVMQPERVLEPTPTKSVEVKEGVELYAVLHSLDQKFCSISVLYAFHKSYVINCLCIVAIALSCLLPIVHFTSHSNLKLSYWETLPCRNSVVFEALNTISCEIWTVFRLKSRGLSRGGLGSGNKFHRTFEKREKKTLIRLINWLLLLK